VAQSIFDTPIGPLFADASAGGLRLLTFLQGARHAGHVESLASEQRPQSEGEAIIEETRRQIEAYFAGDLRRFDLPIDLKGTPFRRRVWQAIAAIPFGETASYAEVAAEAGAPGAYRAAGSACGANPIVIVVPCHRVVGSDRGLHGFGGGLSTKVALLRHEGSLHAVKPAAIELAERQAALI
jgi:methylated-DNA-[protein]-cysteine S-methyltransferase